MWRRFFIVAAFIPVMLLLNSLYRRVPSDIRVLGEHARVNGHSVIINWETEWQTKSGLAVATLEHEMLHSLKSEGYFDRDVPYAAAVGYYVEWKKNRRLFDNNDMLSKGLVSAHPEQEILRIVGDYNENADEDEKSYRDAAYLVGLVANIFRDDVEAGERYLFCLAMNVDPHDGLDLARARNAYKMILDLRYGAYTSWDEEQFNADLAKTAPTTQEQVTNYKRYLTKEYQILYVRRHSKEN